MPGLRDFIESQLPQRRPNAPEGLATKLPTPPLFGPGALRNPVTDAELIRRRDALMQQRKAEPENPFYVPGELHPEHPGILTIGKAGTPPLAYKNAQDERSAQTLWKDSSVLDQYYNRLAKKGMSEEDIVEVLTDLAKQQKAARAEFYAKPVELKITEDKD